METLTERFLKAQTEFFTSNASEKSIENISDIVCFLKERKERNFEENYILAQAYNLLGENIFASKIIEKSLLTAKDIEIEKLRILKDKIDSRDIWRVKHYRDLRDSKAIKESTKLSIEDFIVSEDIDNTYCIKISERIKKLVIINKHMRNESKAGDRDVYYLFSEKKPSNFILQALIEYIIWLGGLKNELINFYNASNFDHKLNDVGQDWFDGLEVYDLSINVDKNDSFNTEIILFDYLQNDFGFRLEIENRTLKSIEYDPQL